MADDAESAFPDCEEFRRRLPSLVETGEHLYRDDHLKTCATCRGLVVDLEKIAEDAGKSLGSEN